MIPGHIVCCAEFLFTFFCTLLGLLSVYCLTAVIQMFVSGFSGPEEALPGERNVAQVKIKGLSGSVK